MRTHIVRAALVTAGILLVPFFGNLYVDGWNWHWYTFVLAGTLLFGAGLTYELVANTRTSNRAYRLAVGLAVVTGFVLTWTNMVFTSESDNPVNLLFFVVPLVGMIGAAIVHLEPRGMARALFATALAQMLVAAIVRIMIEETAVSGFGSMARSGFFATLWLGSAWLFRKATDGEGEPGSGIAPSRTRTARAAASLPPQRHECQHPPGRPFLGPGTHGHLSSVPCRASTLPSSSARCESARRRAARSGAAGRSAPRRARCRTAP